MEQEKDSLKKQVKELTDKIANQPKNNSTVTLRRATNAKSNNLAEEKVKVRNNWNVFNYTNIKCRYNSVFNNNL